MAALYTLIIEADPDQETASTLASKFDLHDEKLVLRAVQNHLNGLNGGVRRAHVRAFVASACASGTVTCDQSSAVDATDTVTIAGTQLAVVASPSTTAQFAKGASDAEMAENLADCINANATLNKLVYAKASAAVVTITSKIPGPIGNLITLAEAGSGMALSGAVLANGAADETDSYVFGYDPTV